MPTISPLDADRARRGSSTSLPVMTPAGPAAAPGAAATKIRTVTGMVPIVAPGANTAEQKRTLTGMVPIPGPTRPNAPAAPMIPRDPRAPLIVPVRYKYESFIDFVETQSMNVSRSGMFVMGSESLTVGTVLDFEFLLADGFAILKGKAEVVRASKTPPVGLGVRFQKLDEASRKLIDRIVEVNTEEGKKPSVPLDFTEAPTARPPGSSPGVSAYTTAPTPSTPALVFDNRDLHMRVNPVTVGYFLHNPLLNIRLGGFVVPCAEDVPLGTMFNVTITDVQGQNLFSGKGKVVAKHELRLGIRLTYNDKAAIGLLQAEISKLAPSK